MNTTHSKFGAARRARRSSQRSILQPLESRRLLSGAQLVDGVLKITGSDNGDTIAVSASGANLVVSINGDESSFAAADVNQIYVTALGGDDGVSIDDAVEKPSKLFGQDGNDSLKGGTGDTTLNAGAGDDTLAGGGPISSKAANVTTADYSETTADWSISTTPGSGRELHGADGEVDTLGTSIERFLSGSGNDTLYFFAPGENDIDYVDAGAGNDTIGLTRVGYNRDITVHGGAGDDTISLYSPHHSGFYFGDAGDDTFTVSRSSWTARDFHGGDGIDTVDYSGFISPTWNVKVTLDDVADDGSYTEYKDGSSPDNVHTDMERVVGNSGDDTLIGGNNNDALVGGGGDDCLVGNEGNDTLLGNDGDDTLSGGTGADSLDGGAGRNSIMDQATLTPTPETVENEPVITNPPDSPVSTPISLVHSTLKVVGSEAADTILVRLKSGDSSTLQVSFNGAVSEFRLADVERLAIYGGGDNDRITVDSHVGISSRLYGDDGNDTIRAAAGRDRVYGGAGSDWIAAGTGSDTVYGEAGNDRLFGGAGRDYLFAGAGHNLLRGEAGKDRIVGTKRMDDTRGNAGDLITI